MRVEHDVAGTEVVREVVHGSGVPAITMTGITTPHTAQTCESRILARTDAESRRAPVSAWAIADVGPAVATPSSADHGGD